MRCAISLASVTISLMVRLSMVLLNTLVGSRTPTTAQTSLTVESMVTSSSLVRSSLLCHSHQCLAGVGAVRSLPGVGGDVVAQLLQPHAVELTVCFVVKQLRFVGEILLENRVAGAQRFQLGDH